MPDLNLPFVEEHIALASRDPLERYDMTDALCVRYIFQKSMAMLYQANNPLRKDMRRAFKLAMGLRKSIESPLLLGEPSRIAFFMKNVAIVKEFLISIDDMDSIKKQPERTSRAQTNDYFNVIGLTTIDETENEEANATQSAIGTPLKYRQRISTKSHASSIRLSDIEGFSL